jgi:hypothetical protein
MIKTDSQGDVVWDNTFTASLDSRYTNLGIYVEQTAYGYFLISNSTWFNSDESKYEQALYFVETDHDGNLIWDYVSDVGNAISVKRTTDGGFIVLQPASADCAERTYDYDPIATDYKLVKLDSQYNVEWTNVYGGYSNDDAFNVIQTDDGGYMIIGYSSSGGAEWLDIYIVKTDSNGNVYRAYYIDSDGDLWGDPDAEPVMSLIRPAGQYVRNNLDCDDTDNGINPCAIDLPGDGIDQNCDGVDGYLYPVGPATVSKMFNLFDAKSVGFFTDNDGGDLQTYYDENGNPYYVKLDTSGNELWRKSSLSKSKK